jgi:ATP-dependent RNA helicase RhlE
MIQIGRPCNPIETIAQHWYPVAKQQKMELLLHMLKGGQMESVLVFSRTKHGADKINKQLQRAGIVSVAMHSDRTQGQRQRAMDGFRSGRYQVMVATDIAARGIDVEGISHVVNFDVPVYAEDYLHRIGRTGRATALGDAITLLSPEEYPCLHQIEKFVGRLFDMETCPDFTYLRPAPPEPKPEAKSPPAHRAGGRSGMSRVPRAAFRRRRRAPVRRRV